MSFTDYETSVAQAQPVRLYLFERNSRLYWAYTNTDRAVEFQGRTYLPIAIDDDGIKQTGEPTNDVLSVTVPSNNEIAELFKGAQPSEEIMLFIRELDWNDPADALVVWVGSVASVSIAQDDRAEIKCTSFEASLQRNLLKHTYNRNCRHAIYSKECGLNKDNYRVTGTITAMDGASIVVQLASQPQGSLNYGFIEWPSMNNFATETRGIDYVDGTRIHLIGGSAGLKVGQTIRLYPGCDQSSHTCRQVFNNLINYGGFSYLPGKSPFDGSPVF